MVKTQNIARCHACGPPILPQRDALGLTPHQQMIYNAVRLRPCTAQQLHDLLYADDANGGPDPKIIHVFVNQMNRKLRPWYFMIKAYNHTYYLWEAKQPGLKAYA